MGSDCGSDRTRGGGGQGRGGGGPSVLVRAWEVLGGKRGEREECVVLTFVEKYLCSRGGSRKPAASRRNLLHVPVVSFRTKLALSLLTKPTFVTERISSSRHLLPC